MIKFQRVISKLENKAYFYVAYIVSLILIFCLSLSKGLNYALYGILGVHLFFVLIVSLLSFGVQVIKNFFFPFITIRMVIDNIRIRQYLKKFSQNSPAHSVLVLGHANWLKFKAWIKPNFSFKEIKTIVEYLEEAGKDFSFYPNANLEDVKKIMEDKSIAEVYFWGHGDSHTFQLSTDEILYYCEFNINEHEKQFVHQVHCGTEDGKSLIDYVVPDKNKSKCFFVRKSITGPWIIKEFENRTKQLKRE